MHIILGGTSGLGQELALQLRERGERVLALGKTHNNEQHGEGLGMDLSDKTSVERAIQELEERVGNETIESFYWCAGYGFRGNFGEQPTPELMATVNFAGALPMVQWVWNKMLKQDVLSNLVIVSSTSGLKPRPDEAVYVATKYAQTGLGRSLGLEAKRLNEKARVTLFFPGGMRTPFWNGREPQGYDEYNDPKKVAAKMLETVANQTEHYEELAIERGSLV